MEAILTELLNSDEPVVRWKARQLIDEKSMDAENEKILRDQICQSKLVQALLSERDAAGKITLHPYQKWCGAHWVLAMLAEMGYPPGDDSLKPLFDQVCGWLLSENHMASVKVIHGRARRCGSMEGYALWAAIRLGLDDERCDRLAANLMRWQWPDGGWNCDKSPAAHISSFHETWLPVRSLFLYSQVRGDPRAIAAARAAAEVFLNRRLLWRVSDGSLIDAEFTRLAYPAYWHYGLLPGLQVMAEAGLVQDERCREALDLLESKRLPDGGFPCERIFFRTAPSTITGRSPVTWGKPNPGRRHDLITVEALGVLKKAARI